MAETATQKPAIRVVELDALRAMAAINLMLFHFTYLFQVNVGFSTPLGFEWPFGKYGVQLFFMLSGLVNAMTLLKKRQGDEFLVSRLIRILPSYYLLFLINLVVLTFSPLNQNGGYSLSQILANATLMPNLFGFECLDPVAWTLQIELLFYGILLALFWAGALDRPFRPCMLYLLLCLVGGMVLSHLPADATTGVAGGSVMLLSSLLLFKQMPLFLIGIFIYQLKNGNTDRWSSACGIILSATVFHLIDDHGHNPAVTVFLIGLLGMSAFGKISLLRSPLFVFLSGISYSLYLVHNNLGCVIMHRLDNVGVPPWVCLAVMLVLAVLIASAVTHFIERPASSWLAARWKRIKSAIAPKPAVKSQTLAEQGATVD